MKKVWKRYLACLCVLVCLFSLTACSEEKKDADAITYNNDTAEALEEQFKSYKANVESQGGTLDKDYDMDSYAKEIVDYYIIADLNSNYLTADRKQLEDLVKEDEEEYASLQSYLKATEDIGEFVEDSIRDLSLSINEEEDIITVTGTMEFKKREVMFSSEMKMATGEITTVFEKDLTLGEILSKAGMNTLLGMGTVFLVLILISLIIGCFGLIGGREEKKPEIKEEPAEVLAVEEVEEDAADDLELAAVIAAAIAAAEGTSADGFVVRSIRRVNGSRRRA